MSSTAIQSVLNHAWTIPQGVVCVIGFVLVILNWSRYPSASLLAFLGLGIIFLNLIAGVATNLLIPKMAADGANLARIFGLLGIVRSIADAVGTGLLLFAIYTGRQWAQAGRMPPSAPFPSAPAPGKQPL